MSKLLRSYSAESIAHQNTELFDGLTAMMSKLLNTTPSLKTIKETGIEKLVFDKLGISMEVMWDTNDDINAHMLPPMLDRNHTLFHPMWKPFIGAEDGVKMIHALGKPILTGTVDRGKSKVGGDFSKIAIPVCFYRGLFNSKLLTAREIAAIVLHELGHAFTYFECLSDCATRNYAIVAATSKFLGTDTEQSKILVLREIDQKLGISIPDKELLATKGIDQVYTVITTETMKKSYSQLGTSLYDTRTWESLSDQFASRHGASASLSTALDKIYRRYSSSAYYSTPKFLIVEVLKIVSTVLVLAVGLFLINLAALLLVFNILLSNPFTDSYDRPKDRVARIREDLISKLKDRDLHPSLRKVILEDISIIDGILADMHNRDTFWQSVWRYVTVETASQVNKMEFYKSIERLSNNNLYLMSAKLKEL
jgi:hypothetical protein